MKKNIDNNKILKLDFSGKWILNLNKSFLESPPPDSSVFFIKHNGINFNLERIHIINGKKDVFTIELTIDGKKVIKKHKGIEITAEMYWEGDELIFDSLFKQGTEIATNNVRYKLLNKGNVLVAEETFNSKDHNHKNKWIFDKEKLKKD